MSDDATPRPTHFEEFLTDSADCPRFLGVRLTDSQDGRKCGYYGRRVVELTEPVTLKVGAKERTYKASPRRPLRVVTMLQILG
jgi:hypothetical protein